MIFVVVVDRARIYARGAEFSSQDVSHTAHLGNWPERLVLRDTRTNERFEVRFHRKKGAKMTRQRLETLNHIEALEPTGNGGFRRIGL